MKYDLVGVSGNAFSVMSYVLCAMKDCKMSRADLDAYKQDAMSSDYYHLINVSVDMIAKCNKAYKKMLRK